MPDRDANAQAFIRDGFLRRGTQPRFMVQPPLLPAQPFSLEKSLQARSSIEEAIRRALNG